MPSTTVAIRHLTDGLQKVAEAELNEVQSHIEVNCKYIREWMERQPHLTFKIDDQLLISFLRCSKFSLERTKENIDNYYTMRSAAPEVFANRDPLLPEMQAILSAGLILPLPNPENENGCRIILFRYSDNLDPKVMTIPNLAKLIFMVMDILLREDDNAVVSGIKTLSYCKNFPSKYAVQMTPSNLQRYSLIEEKGFPFRIKGMYYSHIPGVFELVYDVIKVFFSPKIKQRVRSFLSIYLFYNRYMTQMAVYSQNNLNELYENIPRELLPKEFGGCNGSLEDLIVFWKKKVESRRDWFLEDEKFQADERLRPGTPKTCSEVFGVEGSFRKLDID